MSRHWLQQQVAYSGMLLLGWFVIGLAEYAGAVCAVDAHVRGNKTGLVIHLPSNCTLAEKEIHAINSATILDVLAKGQSVDLIGVLVRGDLIFDALPISTTRPTKGLLQKQPAVSGQLEGEGLLNVPGAIMIRDSIVLGAVRHRSARGTLQFEGPLDFRGTIFKGGVDLSRSVFQDGVEISGATFKKEAYFVQGQFKQELKCRGTKFGPHTRFHLSIFHGPVECTGALFDGMAEFLEVTFVQPVAFERARFGLGTGFSGSRFKRKVNFDEAIFSRETFFGFSVFEDQASFARALFLGSVDFSDAEFKKPDNLAQARFDEPPLFTRTKRIGLDQPVEFRTSPAGQYSVTLFFLLMAAVLVTYVLRTK